MRVVLDTNVLVSGIFFGGIPRRLLDAWADDHFELVLSPSIFDEYLKTCQRLGVSQPGLRYQEVLATVVGRGTLVPDEGLPEPIAADPDDDKFMICAHRTGALVVSGDRHLHEVSGWQDVVVRTPRDLLESLPGHDPKAT